MDSLPVLSLKILIDLAEQQKDAVYLNAANVVREAYLEDNEISCGYLGGCGSRMNGRCERTEKCEKWIPFEKEKQ